MARYRHNKQNRCSYCYELGHNARTCPEKTRHLKERAEAEIANGEGKEGYWHKQYARRTGQWADGSSAIEALLLGVPVLTMANFFYSFLQNHLPFSQNIHVFRLILRKDLHICWIKMN